MIVNLTPHPIVLYRGDEPVLTVPPSGTVARVSTHQMPSGEVDGIPVVRTSFGKVENLPERQEGTFYVVSTLVAQAVPFRDDVIAPDTGPESVVRDEDGKIVGVRRFQRW